MTVWLPSAREVADKLTAGAAAAAPVPLSVIVPGLPAALWTMLRDALRGPVATGVNVTEIVHEEAAATEPPDVQLPATAKSPGLLPPSVMLVSVRAAEPVLDTVTVMALEGVPTLALPKASAVAEGE